LPSVIVHFGSGPMSSKDKNEWIIFFFPNASKTSR
jgi:hypothetical protein